MDRPDWLADRRRRAQNAEPAPALERGGRLLPIPPELLEQGLQLWALADLPRDPGLLRWLGPEPDSSAPREVRVAEAWATGGYVVRVPRGIRAEFPLHVSAGPRRFGSVERSLVILEPGSELTLVDGCTDIGGPAGERWSLLDVVLGEGAVLDGSSIQAWPEGMESRALRRFRLAAGARLNWSEVGLAARLVEKRLETALAPGAAADVLCAGYAAAGQRQRVVVEGPGRVLAAGDVEAAAAEVSRWAGGDAASLHRFFEPLARRLPLEFSVEFSRLLDAQL